MLVELRKKLRKKTGVEGCQCRHAFAVQDRGVILNARNRRFAVDLSGARPRRWKSEVLSIIQTIVARPKIRDGDSTHHPRVGARLIKVRLRVSGFQKRQLYVLRGRANRKAATLRSARNFGLRHRCADYAIDARTTP